MTTALFDPPAESAAPPSTPQFYTVRPRSSDCWLLLTAQKPVSHHDAAVQDDSNTQLFNRAAKLRLLPAISDPITQEAIDAFCAASPVPPAVADILTEVAFPEFVAVALVRLFLDLYAAGDGAGIFEGKERYERLETRLRGAAARTGSLRLFWDRLTGDLRVPIHSEKRDVELLAFFALPRSVQTSALRACIEQFRSLVALARLWHSEYKMSFEAYAEKAGREASALPRAIHFDAAAIPAAAAGVARLDTYEVSTNSARHIIVREPGFLHLCGMLGIGAADTPGQGLLPPGAEAIFANGGNIASGAKQPSDPFGLAARIRQAFPLLDLVGGVTDSFDIGASRLRPAAWLVCRENAVALSDTPAAGNPLLSVSALDMADDAVETRQATRQGVGQMIRNFETLADGVQVAVRLSLLPFTRDLTKGALAAALDTYLANHPHIGGQGARGYGVVRAEYLEELPKSAAALDAYESYLADNAESLRAYLTDGTLGSGGKVVS